MSGVDWDAVRLAYDGGRGGSLREVAERFGIPVGTVSCRAGNEGWSGRPRRVLESAMPEPPLDPAPLDGLTRTCPHCIQRTTGDPCAHCGAPSSVAA